MPVDITKIFKANIKAIRISLSDSDDRTDQLNEELFGKSKKKLEREKANSLTASVAKESRLIVT